MAAWVGCLLGTPQRNCSLSLALLHQYLDKSSAKLPKVALAKVGLAEVGLALERMAQVEIGLSRNWPK